METNQKPPAVRKPLHVQINQQEEEMLSALANIHGVSKGHVVRTAVRVAYQMHIQHVPLCASGSPCFVPHMHAAQPRPVSVTVTGIPNNGNVQ
jgi:hypothetical protein